MTHPTKIVIAHRGASGYLPEHTLAAKAMAYAMGADFLEQDVVLSKDDVPVVLHDIHLDTISDVRTKFSARHREDGRFYAIDFTLEELKSLQLSERFDNNSGDAVYPKRFPVGKSRFGLVTLAEEIEFIQGLNWSSGREVGIYTEIKRPAWHRQQGKDISRIVLDVVAGHGYDQDSDDCFIQCFDATETRRIRQELGCPLPLIQLIGENDWGESDSDFAAMRTMEGLRDVATYANGIGPWINQIVVPADNPRRYDLTQLVDLAHHCGLVVHPFTLRADALPSFVDSLSRLAEILLIEAGADGVFSDFPDLAVGVRDAMIRPVAP